MKNNKGITLIALVVTIIVLLILAGVTIAMLSGENGILNRATSTKEASDLGTAKELISINVNNKISEYYEKKYVNETATSSETIEAAANAGITAATSEGSWPLSVELTGTTKLTYTPSGKEVTITVNSSTGAVSFSN